MPTYILRARNRHTYQYYWLLKDEQTFSELSTRAEMFQTDDLEYAKSVAARQPSHYKMYIHEDVAPKA
jgi:hypothetical protein